MNEIAFMQARLVRMAAEKWHKTTAECAAVFEEFHVYEYIESLYELFHVQGDEADFEEIQAYLEKQGAKI